MLRIVYFFLVSLWVVISLPIFFIRKWYFNKKTPIWKKFYVPKLDKPLEKQVIWVHAVSLGEMKIALVLIDRIRKELDVEFVITTQTDTGYAYAKKQQNFHVYYMPIDFFFLQKRFVKKIKPLSLFLIESDFWQEAMYQVKKNKGFIFLFNGKMSDRSHQRWKKVPFLSKKIFDLIDNFYVQDEEAKQKFEDFVPKQKIQIGGNFKIIKPSSSLKSFHPQLIGKKIVTIACTHEKEELELLGQLKELLAQDYTILIAPRHPERFDTVYHEIQKVIPNLSLYTDEVLTQCVIVNKMGILSNIYPLSEFVVLGGSFSSKKGGHDIFEPILEGAYTYFGPFMQAQKELKKIALEYGLAEEVKTENLLKTVEERLSQNEAKEDFLKKLNNFKNTSKDGFEGVFFHLLKQISVKK